MDVPRAFSPELAQAVVAISAAHATAGEPADSDLRSSKAFVAWVADALARRAATPGEPLTLDLELLSRFEEFLDDRAVVSDLADAWGRVGLSGLRVEVRGPSATVGEWLQELPDALGAKSVWEARPPPRDPSEWAWQWPLDVATVSAAGGAAITHDLAALLKRRTYLAGFVKVADVDSVVAADLLLLRGDPRSATGALRGLNYPRGTPLFLIQGNRPAPLREVRHALEELGSRFPGAGVGYAIVPQRKFQQWFEVLARELSHNHPVDVALFAASRDISASPPVLQASSALLRHTKLERAVAALARRTGALGSRTMAIRPGTSAANVLGRSGDMPAGEVGRRLSAVPPDVGYAAESRLATATAEISAAAPPPEPAHRFLQTRLRAARGKGMEDTATWIRATINVLSVRVGTRERGWRSPEAAEPFPVEKVVGEEESIEAEVICDVKGVLHRPLRQLITLRRHGVSSVCEFPIRLSGGRAELTARITVTHGGRIIQSGRFSGPVRSWRAKGGSSKASWRLDTVIRSDLTGLARRRRFDSALLLEAGSLRATNPAAGLAYMLPQVTARLTQFLDDALSDAADDPDAYKGGLGNSKVLELLGTLARIGSDLREQLEDQHRGESFLRGTRLQVVSTRPDARLPIELLYDGKAPLTSAKLCKHAANSLKARLAHCRCQDITSKKTLCPYRFWGLSRVIERHLEPGDRGEIDGDFALRPQPIDPEARSSGMRPGGRRGDSKRGSGSAGQRVSGSARKEKPSGLLVGGSLALGVDCPAAPLSRRLLSPLSSALESDTSTDPRTPPETRSRLPP